MLRIGIGYDSHAFCEGAHVPIGGVKIPYHRGIKAHSDGDVLLHAIGDALLGAAALGDLGHFFPDNNPDFVNMDSQVLLDEIKKTMDVHSFKIHNVDASVIAEAPKLADYINQMRENIASILALPVVAVSVKATTNEKMGWIGRGEGIAAQAVVLIDSTF